MITLQWILIGYSLSFGDDIGNGIISRVHLGFEHPQDFNKAGMPNNFSNDVCHYRNGYYCKLFG